jgi:hypothetical protein
VTLGLPVLRTLVALLASFSQISLANLSTPATQGTRDLGTRPYALASLLFYSGPSPNQFIRRLKKLGLGRIGTKWVWAGNLCAVGSLYSGGPSPKVFWGATQLVV